MDDALYYLSLNRQVGLFSEMAAVANNIANVDTPGYQRRGVAFTEFVVAADGGGESISMGHAGASFANPIAGRTEQTGNRFDVALEGEGFFLAETIDGPVLTRGGSFAISPTGLLVTHTGLPVLDNGEAPIPIPADAKDIEIAGDGTVSSNGNAIAQLAVVNAPAESLQRIADTAYTTTEAFEPVEFPKVRQGVLERSNVDPVVEIARMIQVQRSYEAVQSLIIDEDRRINDVITTLRQES